MPLAHPVLDRHTVVAPDGIRLSVLLARPPEGTARAAGLPPVLAVHGFASSAASGWRRTGHLDALTRAGRVVIAPDLRGHGRSERPHDTGAYTLTAVLADLVAVAGLAGQQDASATGSADQRATSVTGPADQRATSVTGQRGVAVHTPIDLLGYSLGARLSWTLACQGLVPVRRMVLGGFDGRPLFQGVDTERLERLADGVPGNDRVALRHLVAGLAGTGGAPASGRLPSIPTLLIAGDRDALATRARHLASELPDGSFLSVPGRDHISTVPAAAFRHAVVDFLAGQAAVGGNG